MQDPKLVVDTLLAEGTAQADKKIVIYQVTIRRYALLEKLGSPFIDPDSKFTVDSIIPSVYVMTRTKDELKKICNAPADQIRALAFDWSEDLDLDDIPKMVEAVTDQFLKLQRAAPEAMASGQDTAKKNQDESM